MKLIPISCKCGAIIGYANAEQDIQNIHCYACAGDISRLATAMGISGYPDGDNLYRYTLEGQTHLNIYKHINWRQAIYKFIRDNT